MLNLAIECSGIHGSVALFERERLLAVQDWASDLASVQALAPTIESILGAETVGLISVTAGPGSFTGLRVGITTAKVLAMAWRIPVVGVDTLDAIAHRQMDRIEASTQVLLPELLPRTTTVISVMNAFRSQVFSSAWQKTAGGTWSRERAAQVVNASKWSEFPFESLDCSVSREAGIGAAGMQQADVETLGAGCVVSGPGLEVYQPKPHVGLYLAPADQWNPRAEEVGRLGWQAFEKGQAQTAEQLQPNYVRGSAAEEQLKQK